jgi:hypothetical protein
MIIAECYMNVIHNSCQRKAGSEEIGPKNPSCDRCHMPIYNFYDVQ